MSHADGTGRDDVPPSRVLAAIGWTFAAFGILAGTAALVPAAAAVAAGEWLPRREAIDVALVAGLRFLAGAGGLLVLAGSPWGRWLLVAWLAAHVTIGAMHSIPRLVVHAVLFVVVSYLLFRPPRARAAAARTRWVRPRR